MSHHPHLPPALFTLALLSTAFASPARAAEATTDAPDSNPLTIRTLDDGGTLEIVDSGVPVLRYHYQIVPRPADASTRFTPANQKYAVPRSDYIHPLYGPNGEVLTDDWPAEHPHHRGIYWAWPEVDWQGHRGDLHALQHVFSRPTGKIAVQRRANYVQIVAENEWRWEDRTPIVREIAIIRAGCKTPLGRPIDLDFEFTAIDDDVQVARRGTKSYGGLNLRFSPMADPQIATFTDPPTAALRRAWANRSGIPQGGNGIVGITLLQSPHNPEFPGDWVQYPNLSWLQPTFPTSGTRYTITKHDPLELRYRIWVYDGRPSEADNAARSRWAPSQPQ